MKIIHHGRFHRQETTPSSVFFFSIYILFVESMSDLYRSRDAFSFARPVFVFRIMDEEATSDGKSFLHAIEQVKRAFCSKGNFNRKKPRREKRKKLLKRNHVEETW